MSRRRGRVARLPNEIREQVNVQLLNGIPYAKIGEWLAERGHPGFNENHIRAWCLGGHRDWLEGQERLQQVRAKREAAREVTLETEPGIFEAANSELASSQVFEGLNAYQPETLAEALNKQPELYIRLLNTFIRLNREALSRRNAQLRLEQLKAKQMKRGESLPSESKEFSAETIRKMQEMLGWVAKPEPEPGEGKETDGSQRELPDGGPAPG